MANKKYNTQSDPNKKEEAQKYANPIPSREVIIKLLKDNGVPIIFEKVFSKLGLTSDDHHVALKRRLRAMERDGQIVYNRRGYYGLVEKMNLVKGKVVSSKDGPGELITIKGKNIFLPTQQMKCVFHGDIVLVRPAGINRKGHLEGIIEEILERNTKTITGRYYTQLGVSYVIPVNSILRHDILIFQDDDRKIDDGQLVNVEIISQPAYRTQPLGKVIEVLGSQIAISEVIDMAIKTYNISNEWSHEICTALNDIPDHVTANEIKARKDLRALPFVTIDGADAKDFDDAVYCETKKAGGWRLYVAIADVSYYVRDRSKIDFEARMRSTSVYFPGFVIPMLPEKLSNELCSLKPNQDRLALICEMTISAKGKLSGYKFYSGVINSKARLTYTQVADLIEQKNKDFYNKYPDLAIHIYNLYGLYLSLKEQRQLRGAIEFDTIESQVNLNTKHEIESIQVRSRNDAHRLIEECMLLTNVAVAKFITKHKTPSPYRVHERPFPEKVVALREYLKVNGMSLTGGDDPSPQDYANMLEQAKRRKDFNNIQLVALKSMNQAIYSPENDGHFGLAYLEYTHFTSPIRRYPDLLTHRAIKSIIGESQLGAKKYSKEDLIVMCEHASIMERKADSASKDVEEWLKCSFMKNRIGENFSATIVSVLGFGIFVQLTDNYIEGLVHISSLDDDYYNFDSIRHLLIGERTRREFGLGDKLQVRLIKVDMTSFKIDFELTERNINTKASSARKKNKRFQPKAKSASIEKRLKKIAENIKKYDLKSESKDVQSNNKTKAKKKSNTQNKK